MRVYKSYTKASAYEILVASLTLFGIALWGGSGLALLALFGLRPLILKIENKNVDDNFWIKHFKVIKLSIVLTSVTIILVYGTAELILGSGIKSDFILKMILPYFILIHGCTGIIFFSRDQSNKD